MVVGSSPSEAANFSLKMTVSGEMCCVALAFSSVVVVVALPFSSSLEVIVHGWRIYPSHFYIQNRGEKSYF